MHNCKFYSSKYYSEEELATCQEQPHLLCGCFIKVFYKTTICPKQPVLSGPKSGCLLQVWLYHQTFPYLSLELPAVEDGYARYQKSFLWWFFFQQNGNFLPNEQSYHFDLDPKCFYNSLDTIFHCMRLSLD